jgi:predicted nucleic acid-binding protein
VTTDTDRSQQAIRLLNQVDDGYTAIVNLMELRSVLETTVVFPDASDIVAANTLQQETLLYPMDAIVLATADSVECPLVSFDSELRDHGAVEPAELLE